MRRVYQVDSGPIHSPFGSAWGFIEAGGASTPHTHTEEETFYIVEGQGLMIIESEEREVQKGDVIYIPADHNHVLRNIGNDTLTFITVWWEASTVRKGR
ncbi:cupin domain-containing protein [Xylanibacillus composti]|nr:cupin domain-containing protein [Xylanibacillus composti]